MITRDFYLKVFFECYLPLKAEHLDVKRLFCFAPQSHIQVIVLFCIFPLRLLHFFL